MKKGFDVERLEPFIFLVRGRRVLLDADLARLYGVSTKRFNEAFKRNRHRFPDDFAFQLTTAEVEKLRARPHPNSSQLADLLRHNWSQFAASPQRGRTYLPWAFTEHGALMAANILRSDRAVQMSVFIVRAFIRLREQVAANTAVLKRLAEIDRTLLRHDPPKRRIGFHSED